MAHESGRSYEPSRVRRLVAGVRARSTLFAALVVVLGAAVGSVLLIFLLQRALISSVEDNAGSRASDVADQISRSSMASVQRDLEQNTRESQLIQVIGPDDVIVASSSERGRTRLLSSKRPGPGRVVQERRDTLDLVHPADPYLVTARGVEHQGTSYTIVVAASMDAQSGTVEQLVTYLLIGIPLATLLVAVGIWFLIGRSLRPVELIRARVAGIGSEHLAERVPVPRSHDEVSRLAVTMNGMLERLESGQQVQRAFVSDASHELRSPLATLAASLEIAGSDPTGRTWGDLKDVMGSEVVRMERLVADLLLLAKADDRGLRLRHDDVDLDDILGAEIRRLRAGGTVSVDARIRPVRISGDTARLSQMVRNLVENASVAARSHVRVSVEEEQGSASITVEDDGPGVAEAERDRVFDRFVRLDASRSRDSGGSGLGLAIVREIAHGHGGSVSVAESDLGGARFVVRLPGQAPT